MTLSSQLLAKKRKSLYDRLVPVELVQTASVRHAIPRPSERPHSLPRVSSRLSIVMRVRAA